MLGFRPLQIAKRKLQPYAKVPAYDVEDAEYNEKYHSDDDDDDDDDVSYAPSSSTSSPASSRASSAVYEPRKRPVARSTVSAYSYRNPRAFTRYFGFAIAATLLMFMYFLLDRSWASMRYAEMGLHKSPPPKPVWESFPFLKRYHGGIRTLVSRTDNVPEYPTRNDIEPEMPPQEVKKSERVEKRMEGGALPESVPFVPYPDYESREYVEEFGPVRKCFLDANDTVEIPAVRVYQGVTEGTPDNVMGSYELFGMRNDVCFERFGRLGPYGLGYSTRRGGTGAGMEGDREGIEAVWKDTHQIDFRQVRWGEAVERCLEKNKERFKSVPKSRENAFQSMGSKKVEEDQNDFVKEGKVYTNGTAHEQPKAKYNKLLPRTAVLLRTWHDYEYGDEDIMYLRSLISELSIGSGGEYQVHFLIHVKDDNKQIWADEQVYQEVLDAALPAEFAGMGTLWSERQMGLIYGGLAESMFRDLPVHGNYRSTWMPVTYFAHMHPEFEHFWNWEMDVRYTGHFYHLFHQIEQWANKQPRRGLWERNARFYVPAVHDSWDDFSAMVRVQTEHGTNNKANRWSSHLPPNPHVPEIETQKPEKPVWGPEVPLDYPSIELDPTLKPPHSMTADKALPPEQQWGVNEAADLIVLNPLFDPDHTTWLLANDITGYNTSQGPPPRRAAINTSARLSRRLLTTMHREQSLHRHTMSSEMFPASVALHHGFKAVYAPHPVFIDRRWPVQYLAAIFNNGRNGASGGGRLSVFSEDRQHNFLGTTWFYNAGHAGNFWRRWLGYVVDNDGGEEEEVAGEGRMCSVAVLLHPVKEVKVMKERREGEGETRVE